MTRRKSVCTKWTLVLLVVLVCPFVYTRPQETSSPSPVLSSSIKSVLTDKPTEAPSRNTSVENKNEEVKKSEQSSSTSPPTPNSSRNVKGKAPVIGESMKMVANQLLEGPSNTSVERPLVSDTRIPPKLKNQLAHKQKVKTRNEDGQESIEKSHVGVAVPVTIEELETENKITEVTNESSTSNEGISTWILLSNPSNNDSSSVPTEPSKIEETQKKQKPAVSKNKTKRPVANKASMAKRPIIGSTNKSDLVAGGSAINENIYNKLKDTVLSNVQKNKNASTQRTTTVTSTTAATTTVASTTKKEVATKAPTSVAPVVKVTAKPIKKKKNKPKVSSTPVPVSESALLPMEPKEQEIELEVSTPATTTKKPKRSSTRKKNKTKKRKTSKPKPESETSVSEVKTSNKTKSNKPSKKPNTQNGPITTQIYNYLSREVMPSVGVGVIGLASLVGLASYFFYPFGTPVRRTFEVDKKDDIYKHNAEEYASEGNGQAEEEMLGTVLAGMPNHSKHKLNPYAGQTAHVSRYPVKKEQDLRYRHVATSYDPSRPTKYNVHYPQQKTGIAHGAVFSEPLNYNPQQYETRHVYTTEAKYTYDKGSTSYTPYPAVEPIYAAPQTGPSGLSSYGSDTSNSVVYGVKPSSDSDFKPVYPFDGQFFSETTSSPITYPPTSMYLGSNKETETPEESKYADNSNGNSGAVDNKFVVGNVPKELVDTATPAVVPEHGPRNLSRRKRSTINRKRSITGSIEEILKAAKENNKDIFISNEIDEALGIPIKNLAPERMPMKDDIPSPPEVKNVHPVYSVSIEPVKDDKTTEEPTSTIKTDIIESVSTLPIDNKQEKTTTESEISNELDITTKSFKVYEVFSSNNPADVTDRNSPLKEENTNSDTTTQFKNTNAETTTDVRDETESTVFPFSTPISETKQPDTTVLSTSRPKPTYNPEVITYPPLNQDGGFFSFLKRLVEFKYRLGLSILQTTSESLNRYLRSMENTVQKVANASRTT